MNKYIGIYIAILYFILQSFLALGAGMSWDEPQNFFNGTKTLRFFQTGDRRYVDSWGDTALFAGDHMTYMAVDANYPPGAALIGAVFSTILSDSLHIVDWIDGFHIGEIAIGSVGVGTFYYLGVFLGLTPSISLATTVLFALYPTIFGQMRADAKDIPMMSALIIFVYAFLRFIKNEKLWWGIVAFVVLGVATWMKPTAPIILVPAIILARKKLIFLPLFLAISVGVFYALWPYVWSDPVGKLGAASEFFRTIGLRNAVLYFGKFYQAGIDLPWHYPWVILAIQTPVEIIVLAFVGIVAAWKKKHVFIILWFILGMARFVLPGFVIYAKIRHFIDVMPAFFLLVGFGLQGMRQQKLRGAFILIVLAHVLWIDVTFYPYEPSYFNFLVGGTKRVAVKQLFDVEHWGTATASAMQFINSQKGEVTVYGCRLNHLARLYARPQVKIVAVPRVGSYVLVPNMPSEFVDALSFYKKHQTLVYTVKRAEADLFYVYTIDNPGTFICGGEVATGENV